MLDAVGDNVDVVGSVMSAHDARKRGNSQQAALDSMDAINSGMGYVTKGLSSLDLARIVSGGEMLPRWERPSESSEYTPTRSTS